MEFISRLWLCFQLAYRAFKNAWKTLNDLPMHYSVRDVNVKTEWLIFTNVKEEQEPCSKE